MESRLTSSCILASALPGVPRSGGLVLSDDETLVRDAVFLGEVVDRRRFGRVGYGEKEQVGQCWGFCTANEA